MGLHLRRDCQVGAQNLPEDLAPFQFVISSLADVILEQSQQALRKVDAIHPLRPNPLDLGSRPFERLKCVDDICGWRIEWLEGL